jgi:hypothetical protein
VEVAIEVGLVAERLTRASQGLEQTLRDQRIKGPIDGPQADRGELLANLLVDPSRIRMIRRGAHHLENGPALTGEALDHKLIIEREQKVI